MSRLSPFLAIALIVLAVAIAESLVSSHVNELLCAVPTLSTTCGLKLH